MPKTRSVAQKRKRRARFSKAAPFPVPIETVTGETASNGHWFYYRGTLIDNSVVIEHTGDMDFLYRMGFFGKGEMSRGQPDWSERSRMVPLPAGDAQQSTGGWGGVTRARVTSRRRYLSHLKWRLMAKGDHEMSEQLHNEEQVITEQITKHTDIQDLSVDFDQSQENTSKVASDSCISVDPDMNEGQGTEQVTDESLGVKLRTKVQTTQDWDEGEGDADFWEAEDVSVSSLQKTGQVSNTWDASDPGDADFWGTGTNATQDVKNVQGDEVSDAGRDSHSMRTADPKKTTDGLPTDKQTQNDECDECVNSYQQISSSAGNQLKLEKCLSGSLEKGGCGDKLSEHDTCDISSENKPVAVCSHHEDHHTTTTNHTSLTDNVYSSKVKSENGDAATASRLNICVEGIVDSMEKDSSKGDYSTGCTQDQTITIESAEEETSTEYSVFCQRNEQVSGTRAMFVIPDSDEEETDKEGRVYRMEKRWKSVLKQDPFPLKEKLQLSLEEAYFLSFGLGCLEVLDPEENALDLTTMWREFCQRQSRFLPNYIAYHYFRSKNWVPKSGLKFGCDFLLYRDGPPFFHGSYSVVVKFLDSSGQPVDGYENKRKFSWTSLAGLKRITEHVGKELLFCYVIKPNSMTSEEMLSPKCISQFQVKEVMVSRWVSSQEREGKGLEEIP